MASAPLSEATIAALRAKVLEFNSRMPPGARITMRNARAAYRQAAFDYDATALPGATSLDWALHSLGLTAAIITDSLGRKYNTALHPRGRDGRFIETGGLIRMFLHALDHNAWATGTVRGVTPDNQVDVDVTASPSHPEYVGKTVRVKPDLIEQAPEVKARIPNGLVPGKIAEIPQDQQPEKSRPALSTPPRRSETPEPGGQYHEVPQGWKDGPGVVHGGKAAESEFSPELAKRLADGTATQADLESILGLDEVGSFWYSKDEGFGLDDSKPYAESEDKVAAEVAHGDVREGSVIAEVPVLLEGHAPKGWSSADNPANPLQGNSYLPNHSAVRITKIHYDGGTAEGGFAENWHTIEVKGNLFGYTDGKDQYQPYKSPNRTEADQGGDQTEPSMSDEQAQQTAESAARSAVEIHEEASPDDNFKEIDASLPEPACHLPSLAASGAALWSEFPLIAAGTLPDCEPSPVKEGALGPDLAWNDRTDGLVISGKTFPVKDTIKEAGFRWNAPEKNWIFRGAKDKRDGALAKLKDLLGVRDPAPVPGVVDKAPDIEEEYPPTPEQQAIIDAALRGDNLIARALAGTGKTSTLQMIARRMLKQDPKKKVAYIAFNKAIQEEADKKMPRANTEARTDSSLAYRYVKDTTPGVLKRYRGAGGEKNNTRVARILGINRAFDLGGDGQMQPAEAAQAVRKAVDNFAISDENVLAEHHFTGRSAAAAKDLLPFAQKLWEDLQAEDGQVAVNNNALVKIWALSRPDFSKPGSGLNKPANVVFMDEAQDTNPVLAKVIKDNMANGIQVVWVGDGNQAIYAFRGAQDQLEKVDVEVDLPLTTSWRYGPEIASVANRFLQRLGVKHRVVGGGGPGVVHNPGTMGDADAILVRTNGGAIREILGMQNSGKLVGVPAGHKSELRSLSRHARFLMGKGPFPAGDVHEDLAPFGSWDEVRAAAEDGEDPKVKMLYKIVNDMGVDALDQLVEQLIDLKEHKDGKDKRVPEVVVSTAHKSKGLEWDRVKISDDFWGPKIDKNTGELIMPSDEELRLAYVAVTRAKKELDPGSLAWIYEYSNENGEGTPPEADAPSAPDTTPPVPEEPVARLPEPGTPETGPDTTPKAPETPPENTGPKPEPEQADILNDLGKLAEQHAGTPRGDLYQRASTNVENAVGAGPDQQRNLYAAAENQLKRANDFAMADRVKELRQALPEPNAPGATEPHAPEPSLPRTAPAAPSPQDVRALRRAEQHGEARAPQGEEPFLESVHGRQRHIQDRPGQRAGRDRGGNEVFVGAKVRIRARGKRAETEGIVARANINRGNFVVRIPDANATKGYREIHPFKNNIDLISNDNLEENLLQVNRQIAQRGARRIAPNQAREDLQPIVERAHGELHRGDRVRITDGPNAGRVGDIVWLQDPEKGNNLRVRPPEGGRPIQVRNHQVEKIGGPRAADRPLHDRGETPVPQERPAPQAAPDAQGLFDIGTADGRRAEIERIRDLLPEPQNRGNKLPVRVQDLVRARVALNNAAKLDENNEGQREQMAKQLLNAEEILKRADRPIWVDRIHQVRERLVGNELPGVDRRERLPLTQPRQEFPAQREQLPADREEARGSRPLSEPAFGRQPKNGMMEKDRQARVERQAAADEARARWKYAAEEKPMARDPEQALADLKEINDALKEDRKNAFHAADANAAHRRERGRARLEQALGYNEGGDKDKAQERADRAVKYIRGLDGQDDNKALADRIEALSKIAFEKQPSALFRREEIEAEQPTAPEQRLGNNAVAALDQIITRAQGGGFTFNPRDGGFPDQGFVVAYPGFEQKLSARAFSREAVRDYILTHAQALRDNPNLHLGGWFDGQENAFFLDLSEIYSDRAQAERIGRSRGERAIFDLGNLATIDLREGGDNGGQAEDHVRTPEPGGDGRGVRGPPPGPDGAGGAAPTGGAGEVRNPPPPELIQRFRAIQQFLGQQAGQEGVGGQRAKEAALALNRAARAGGPFGEDWGPALRDAHAAMVDGHLDKQAAGLQKLANDFQKWADTEHQKHDVPNAPAPEASPESFHQEPINVEPLSIDQGEFDQIMRNVQDAVRQNIPVNERAGDRDLLALQQAFADHNVQDFGDALDALAGHSPELKTALQPQRDRFDDLVRAQAGQPGLFTNPPERNVGEADKRVNENAEIQAIRDEVRKLPLGGNTNVANAITELQAAQSAQDPVERNNHMVSAERKLALAGHFDLARRVKTLHDPDFQLPPDDAAHRRLEADLRAIFDAAENRDQNTALVAVSRMLVNPNPDSREFQNLHRNALVLSRNDEEMNRNIDNALRRFNGDELRRGPAFRNIGRKNIEIVPNLEPEDQIKRAQELAGQEGLNPVASRFIDEAANLPNADPEARSALLQRAESFLANIDDIENARKVRALRLQVDALPVNPEFNPDEQQAIDDLNRVRKNLRRFIDNADQNDPASREIMIAAGRAEQAARGLQLMQDNRLTDYRDAFEAIRSILADNPDLQPVFLDVMDRLPQPPSVPPQGGDAVYQDVLQRLNGIALTGRVPNGPNGLVIKKMGGGINGSTTVMVFDPVSGRKFVLKRDTGRAGDGKAGTEAELDTALLYRTLGFHQTHVQRVTDDPAAGDQVHNVILMDWVGTDQGLDPSKVARVSDFFGSPPGLSALQLEDEADVWRMVITNGLNASTDKHGQNIMYGRDADGHGYILPMDHGLAQFNAGFASKAAINGPPIKAVLGHYGNPHKLRKAAKEYVHKYGRERAKSELTAWAEHIREVVKQLEHEFQNQQLANWMDGRITEIIRDADGFIQEILVS